MDHCSLDWQSQFDNVVLGIGNREIKILFWQETGKTANSGADDL